MKHENSFFLFGCLRLVAFISWRTGPRNHFSDRFMSTPPPPDRDTSLGDGDLRPSSLDDVWNRFGDQLRRRARTRLRQYGLSGQAESMDICNDVFAEMARRSKDGIIKIDDLVSYLLRAIDNQVLDTFRTLARQCRDFRRVDRASVDEIPLQSQAPTPSQLAIRREVLDRVRSLLGADDAIAIDMMLENRDWKEIGHALRIDPDTARMRVRRALDRVRDRLVPAE